jgi:hypothetical protein
MGYWAWVFGTAILIAIRTASAVTIETTHRRTKVALLRNTRAAGLTVDRHGADVFWAGGQRSGCASDEAPGPEGG